MGEDAAQGDSTPSCPEQEHRTRPPIFLLGRLPFRAALVQAGGLRGLETTWKARRRGRPLSRGRVRLDLVARGLGLPAGPNRSLADCDSVLGCRRSLTRARAGPGLAARLALAPQHGGHVRAVLKSPLLLASQVPAGVLGAQSASCRVGSVVLVASPALAHASRHGGGPQLSRLCCSGMPAESVRAASCASLDAAACLKCRAQILEHQGRAQGPGARP